MEPTCYIWSNEHMAWWRPNSAGYTTSLDDAGEYLLNDAMKICATARDGWREGKPPSEIPVRTTDANACEETFKQRHGAITQ